MAETNNPPTFNRSPLVVFATAFALGIALASLVPLPVAGSIVAAVLFTAIAFVSKDNRLATLAIAIGFVCSGATSLNVERQSVSEDRVRAIYDSGLIESGRTVEVEGVLVAYPETTPFGAYLILKSESVNLGRESFSATGIVRIFVPETAAKSEISDFKYGSRLRVACDLEREDQYQNPGVVSRREMLDRQRIDATCAVKSSLVVEHVADESTFLPIAAIHGWRSSWVETFRRYLDQRTAGVMIASLLGNKHFLDRETAELFREGGTFHILVISGLHITFIGGVLYFLLARITRNRWLRFVVVNLILLAYTIAVGADVPVVRAAVMFAILSFGSVIYRQRNLLNSLAASAIVLLAWHPSDLFSPSFQLTFVSVGAIVAIAFPLLTRLREIGAWMPNSRHPFPPNVPASLTRLAETLYWNPATWNIERGRQVWSAGINKIPHLPQIAGTAWQRLARYLFEGVVVSLIVQIVMLPLLVLYFHTVSFSAVVLNIWVGVFIAIESFGAVLGASVLPASALLAGPFFQLAEISNTAMLALPSVISADGMTRFRIPAYSGYARLVYVMYGVPLVALAIVLSRWDPFDLKGFTGFRGRVVPGLLSVSVLAGLMIQHPFSAPRPDGRLRVDFLDVGQGDAALVTFPEGTTMLIDSGGRLDFRRPIDEEVEEPFEPDVQGIGELVVSQVLWAKGYSRVDYLVATHSDADHIQGFTDVSANFSVGELMVERSASEGEEFAELTEIVEQRRISTRFISAGYAMEIGGASIQVLSPGENDGSLSSDNDRSLVIKITYGSRSFLFTGDVEVRAETQLVVPSVDVVKVAHHGSRTSSTQNFIDSSKAKLAVISVGRRSRFGHPHPEVVDRWARSGASVLTTGRSGMITVTTDGTDIDVRDYLVQKK